MKKHRLFTNGSDLGHGFRAGKSEVTAAVVGEAAVLVEQKTVVKTKLPSPSVRKSVSE